MEKHRVRLNICGTEYIISTEEEESYVIAIGDSLEKMIEDIVNGNERISFHAATVLAALNFCDNAQKAEANAAHLRGQLKEYMDDIKRYRDELMAEHKKLAESEKKNLALEKKNSEQSEEIAGLKQKLSERKPYSSKESANDISAMNRVLEADRRFPEEKNLTPGEFLRYFSKEKDGE